MVRPLIRHARRRRCQRLTVFRSALVFTAASLRVVHAVADGGPSLKRVQPRAMGRAFFIKHRMSHLTIAVSDEVNAVMGPVGRVPRGAAAPRPSPAPAATAPATAAAPPARRRSAGSRPATPARRRGRAKEKE